MSDKIIEDLWQIKDNIAREHDYDVESLVAHLQTKQRSASQRVVDLCALRRTAYRDNSKAADKLRH